jgi:hypothetical protein
MIVEITTDSPDIVFGNSGEKMIVTVDLKKDGIDGLKGDTGEQGIQGEKGDKGDKGDTGDTDAYTQSEADSLLANKVDKVSGKSLIDDTEIERLADVFNFDNSTNEVDLGNKVDKELGLSLYSDSLTDTRAKLRYTDEEKTKLAALDGNHFRGKFTSEVLLSAITGIIGDYAAVDLGVGSDVIGYIWDDNDNIWVKQLGSSTAETPASIKSKYESNADTNSLTDILKSNFISAYNWIATNGASLLGHLSSNSNPHNVTASQVGAPSGSGTSSGSNTGDNAANSLYSGLASSKEDASNKSTSTSESASSVKFPVWSAILSYFDAARIRTILGIITLSGSNTGDQDENSIYVTHDFLNIAGDSNWTLASILSGTFASNTTNVTVNNPGVGRVTSSTTPNSGYQVKNAGTNMKLKGGEVFTEIINPLTFTNTTFRFGEMDAFSSIDATNGIYCEYANSGALALKTANAGNRTSVTVGTLSLNNWYKLRVTVNPTATSVVAELFNNVGALIATSAPITTNIPSNSTLMNVGFVVTNSGSTATALLDVDLINLKLNNLTR